MRKAVLLCCLSMIIVVCPGFLNNTFSADNKGMVASTQPGKVNCPKCTKPYQLGLVRCPNPDCKTQIHIKCANPACEKPIIYGIVQCPHCEKIIPYSTMLVRIPADQKSGGGGTQQPPGSEKKPESRPAAQPESKPASRPQSAAYKKAVATMVDYYVKLYSKHFKSRDWFVRSLAVVALARIDDPKTTDKILETLKNDKSLLVKLYAWESLHTRVPSLDKEQYSEWVKQGTQASIRGGFLGDFRVPLVKALAHSGPTRENISFILRVLSECRHTDPNDSRTLTAVRDVVKDWHDPKFSRLLVARFSAGSPDANKYEYVMGGFDSGIEPIGSTTSKTSKKDWTAARSKWFRWLNENKMVAAKPGEVARYAEKGKLIPEPGVIDPRDPKWREDLEIDKLRVDSFDLVFCIDSTSSMLQVMKWVSSQVIRMLGAFELVSREPRIGITLFRHEVDPNGMHKCCKECDPGKNYMMDVPNNQGGVTRITFKDYRTKTFPLTGRVGDLARWLDKEKAAGAHHSYKLTGGRDLNGGPGLSTTPAGAPYGGLVSSVKDHKWIKARSAKKLIVILGDSPYTAGTTPMAEKLAKDASDRGFIIHTVKVLGLAGALPAAQMQAARSPMFLPGFHKIAAAGGGKCITTVFDTKVNIPLGGQKLQVATPRRGDTSFHTIVGEIIRSTIPEGYHKRVDPLVKVLLEFTSYPPKAGNVK